MIKQKISGPVLGFIVLFGLYHAAEYFILFKYSPPGFLIFQALFFLTAWLLARWQFKKGFSCWGLDSGNMFLKHLGWGMIMGLLLYGLTYFTCLISGIEEITVKPAIIQIIGPLSLFIFGNFFSSLSEDILTRGYLYKHLHGKLNNKALIVISSSVYLLNHIYRLGDGIETYTYLFLLGVLFVVPLILTNRLWFTSGMHWAGNCFFYLSHEIIQTTSHGSFLSPNLILIIFIVILIPLNYLLLQKLRFINPAVMNTVKKKGNMDNDNRV